MMVMIVIAVGEVGGGGGINFAGGICDEGEKCKKFRLNLQEDRGY